MKCIVEQGYSACVGNGAAKIGGRGGREPEEGNVNKTFQHFLLFIVSTFQLLLIANTFLAVNR